MLSRDVTRILLALTPALIFLGIRTGRSSSSPSIETTMTASPAGMSTGSHGITKVVGPHRPGFGDDLRIAQAVFYALAEKHGVYHFDLAPRNIAITDTIRKSFL